MGSAGWFAAGATETVVLVKVVTGAGANRVADGASRLGLSSSVAMDWALAAASSRGNRAMRALMRDSSVR